MIKNDVMVNEELDPKLMIQKLKREVQSLKEELALATGEQRTDALTDEELDRYCMCTVPFSEHLIKLVKSNKTVITCITHQKTNVRKMFVLAS